MRKIVRETKTLIKKNKLTRILMKVLMKILTKILIDALKTRNLRVRKLVNLHVIYFFLDLILNFAIDKI
jgi:hypothetical protein